jgi:hypothetical protein
MRIALTALPCKLLLVLMLLPAASIAQESTPPSAHWAYSAYFGTGWYRVSGDRNVYIVRMTPRWTWSDASLDDAGKRTVGLQVRAPISVGLDRFDYNDIPGAIDIDNVSFLSANPGIDVEIPINHMWSLRPYASLGFGRSLGNSDSAWTYWAGVKSRVAFRSGKLNWQLLNQVGFVGYTPNEGRSDAIWPIMTGLEFDYPVGAPTSDGDQLLLHWRAAYTVFEADLDFARGNTVVRTITDQWEIGVAFARRDSQIPIWFLKFDMLGLGYRASASGDLTAVTFLFRSLFDL